MIVHERIARYVNPRGGCNSWAQSPETIAAWLRRDLAGVLPRTLEISPAIPCNADCVLCPFRRSRINTGSRRLQRGTFVEPNGTTVATREIVRRVLDAAAAAGVTGAVWTGGGEPTLVEALPAMCADAAERGMNNALYTNGFLFGEFPALAARMLAPDVGMVFVRVSVNAVSPSAVQQHWGIRDPAEAYAQLAGLEELLAARERFSRTYPAGKKLPSIQISTIVDHKNVDDLPGVCRVVAEIFSRHRDVRGEEDVMIVRPTTDHRGSKFGCDDHSEAEIRKMLQVVGRGGAGRALLERAGVPLFLGFGLDLVDSGGAADYSSVVRMQYEQRDRCWAHGLFLTVGPDGTVYPCTEMNCNPKYAIGNLLTQSVADIYGSERRSAFLREADQCRWGPEMFQPFSRTTRLDEIAKAVLSNQLTDDDLELIRLESLKSHRLLLN